MGSILQAGKKAGPGRAQAVICEGTHPAPAVIGHIEAVLLVHRPEKIGVAAGPKDVNAGQSSVERPADTALPVAADRCYQARNGCAMCVAGIENGGIVEDAIDGHMQRRVIVGRKIDMRPINAIIIDTEPDPKAREIAPGLCHVDVDGRRAGIVPLAGQQRVRKNDR